MRTDVPKPDVVSALKEADLLVMTSNWEAYPLAMLEAMAAGCLVIGSRTPPVEELITHGENGLLIDFFSTTQLVESIQQVCEHPTRMAKLRESARQTIVDRYDLQTVCLPRQKALIENA